MNNMTLADALQLHDKGVISLMGAGGKTTLMFQLAKGLCGEGKKVLTTTTTKIFMPPPSQSDVVILSPDMDTLLAELKLKLRHTDHITAGKFLIQGMDKIVGFSGEDVDLLWESGLFDWILVEADGAARKPLKACNPTEPIIPEDTSHLILLAGLDALGLPLCDTHVHRSALFCRNTGLSPGQPVDPYHMARGLAVEMKKCLPSAPDAFACVVLNKADTEDLAIKGQSVAGYLIDSEICEGVMVAALESEDPVKYWFGRS